MAESSEKSLLVKTAVVAGVIIVAIGAGLIFTYHAYGAELEEKGRKKQQKDELQALVAKQRSVEEAIADISKHKAAQLEKLPDEKEEPHVMDTIARLAEDNKIRIVSFENLDRRVRARKKPKPGLQSIAFKCLGKGRYKDIMKWLVAVEQENKRMVELDKIILSVEKDGLVQPNKEELKVEMFFRAFYFYTKKK